MKRYITFAFSINIFLAAFFLLDLNSFAQNFPIGVFSAHHLYDDDLTRINIIEDLGVNWVIHGVRSGSAQILQKNFNIIASNTDFYTAQPEHLIIYFTEGYCSTWETNKDMKVRDNITYPVGIIQNGGTLIPENSITIWKSGGVNSSLSGPCYAQEQAHRDGTNNSFSGQPIQYNLDYEIKLVNSYTGNPIDICRLDVYYNNILQVSKTINSTTNSEGPLTTNWKSFRVQYTVPSNPTPSSVTNYHKGLHLGNSVASSSLYGSGQGEGVEFRVISLSSIEYCIRSMKVFDDEIWAKYLTPSNNYPQAVRTYAQKAELNNSKIKYIYSFDEPNIRSHAESYNEIKNQVQSVNGKPLITTFFPQWNNLLNGEDQFTLYKNKFNPSQLLFDYYPVEPMWWPDSNLTTGSISQLRFLRYLLNTAFTVTSNSSNGFFYVAQANSMPTGGVILRQPSTAELNAQVMLALASGAKGIFFYNFYGADMNTLGIYNDFTGGPSDPRSHLFYKIRGDIAPRIKGLLGNTLLTLSYSGNYTAINSEDGIITSSNFPSSSYALISGNNSWSQFINFHLSLFNDNFNSNNKYFFLANLNCLPNQSQNVQIQVSKPNTAFVNWRVKNIEGGFDQSFSSVNTTYTLTLPDGEGYLFQVVPVIKCGGRITANETISSAATLTAPMTIAAGCTLTVSSDYTINSDITVEDGGRIVFAGLGNIIFNNGAKVIQNWNQCLIIGVLNNHPNLIWTPDNSSSVTGYKIYSNYTDVNFTVIQTITDKSVYRWSDILNISGQYATNVQYYIKKTYSDGTLSAASNTAVKTVGDPAAQKRTGEEAVKEKTYEFVTANYPNPFNPSTNINYSIKEAGYVNLTVYDLLGRQIAVLVNEQKKPGSYTVQFNADRLANGIYLYKLSCNNNTIINKMILLK